jgi:3-hydroxymyristoyl/3-hydroxydecanoyl-(acyl carrier protein) dehydratase
VLLPDDLEELTRRLKRGPLVPVGAGTQITLRHAELQRLLPHRAPMLLVDEIDAVDLVSLAIRGRRHLDATDGAFAGHFREEPVYPGVLVVEAMGQLALALLHFADTRCFDVPDDLVPPRVRAVHIHRATFMSPFEPGDTMTLHARVIQTDRTIVTAGQAWKNGTLAAFAVTEVYVDEHVGSGPRRERYAVTRQAGQLSRRTPGAPFGHFALEGFLD